jgi:hypothetical protein
VYGKKSVVDADPEKKNSSTKCASYDVQYIFKIYPNTGVSCLFSLELSTANKRQ